jgi:hypothetical protein
LALRSKVLKSPAVKLVAGAQADERRRELRKGPDDRRRHELEREVLKA